LRGVFEEVSRVRLVLFNIGLHEVGGWALQREDLLRQKWSSKSIYVAWIQEIYFGFLSLHKNLLQPPPSPSKRKSLIPRMGFTWWDRIRKAQHIEKHEAVYDLYGDLIALMRRELERGAGVTRLL